MLPFIAVAMVLEIINSQELNEHAEKGHLAINEMT